MEDGPQYQTPTEAQRILRELVNDERLEFPQELHRFVGGVNFTGITTPILRLSDYLRICGRLRLTWLLHLSHSMENGRMHGGYQGSRRSLRSFDCL